MAIWSPTRCYNRNLIVDLLVILFGISGWVGITSTYLELPLLVETAPEGWTLPSYIVVLVQFGNIGSLAYILYDKYSTRRFNDGHLIYITLAIGCIAAIFMAFSYQFTIQINGKSRSVALLLFTFMFSLVGCLSSVLFMPYMGRFREIYLVTYLFGQGLNGLLSSIMSLIQGVGGQPQCIPNNSTIGLPFIRRIPPAAFGPGIFFIFVFVILALSTIAFVLLNTLEMCKKEIAEVRIGDGNEYSYTYRNTEEYENISQDVEHMSKYNYFYLMTIIGLIAFFGYGIFPGIQSYSCLPYGYGPYHLSVTLSAVANPLACLIAMFLPHASIHNLSIQSMLSLLIGIYLFYTALKSPNPPFVGSNFGNVLIVSIFELAK